jgi:sec-independent protein translocase protein TatA
MGLFQNLTGWHALIILAVIVLLFGATKLPALAKSVGQSMKIFKTEMGDVASRTPAPIADTQPQPAGERVGSGAATAASTETR